MRIAKNNHGHSARILFALEIGGNSGHIRQGYGDGASGHPKGMRYRDLRL